MRKLFFFLPLVVLGLLLSACGGNGSEEVVSNDSSDGDSKENKKIEMVMTSEVPEDHFKSQLMKQFAEDLEARTDGGIEVEFFAAGQLYSDNEALEALGTGSVQSVWPVSVQLEAFNSAYGVLNLPFAISDEQMLNEEYKSQIFDLINPLVEENGMEVAGFLRTADLMFISQNTEMKTYEDIAGMKVRTTGGQILLNIVEQLEASGISLPASEMSTALSQGVIDAVYSSPSGWQSILGTSVPYGYLAPGMNVATYSIVFDKKWLEELPEEYQDIISDLINEIASEQWAQSMEDDQRILEELQEQGVTVHVETEENINKLKEQMQPVYDNFSAEFPEVFNQFQELN
jgi:TRAP-type C4-dicarboxylate transport system substrate-binding protein